MQPAAHRLLKWPHLPSLFATSLTHSSLAPTLSLEVAQRKTFQLFSHSLQPYKSYHTTPLVIDLSPCYAMSASALPATLRSVTSTKIVELKKQRRVFEEAKAAISQEVKERLNNLGKTQALVKGASRLEGVRIGTDSESDEDAVDYTRSSKASELRNSLRLIQQATADPSFPAPAVEKIYDDIFTDLNLKSVQHQHAQFFSELVTEWVSNPEEETSDSDSAFEKVGREEMHE